MAILVHLAQTIMPLTVITDEQAVLAIGRIGEAEVTGALGSQWNAKVGREIVYEDMGILIDALDKHIVQAVTRDDSICLCA